MNKKIIREQFGKQAQAYVNSITHAKGASLPRLVELIEPKNNWDVIDIATGAGHTACALAPFVKTVRATDITPQMLKEAGILARDRGLKNVIVEYADADNLPYENELFDLATCRIAPHHFANINQFIREAVRILKPNGYLAIVDNIIPPGSVGDYVNALEKFRDPSHVRCLTIEEWEQAFLKNNLSIKIVETLAKRLDFTFWAKRHDPIMRNYLKSMLEEISPDVNLFLQPSIGDDGLSFRLVEGIIIGQK